jgi:hypothetical protein
VEFYFTLLIGMIFLLENICLPLALALLYGFMSALTFFQKFALNNAYAVFFLFMRYFLKKGSPMHVAPICAGSEEGSDHIIWVTVVVKMIQLLQEHD